MKEAMPCVYCGAIGHHVWAGRGDCPGAASERERDTVAAVYLQRLSEQNSRLSSELARLKVLLGRAADALEKINALSFYTAEVDELIAELRKAAE